MTVSELASDCGFAIVYLADGDRKVNGAYAGDLLSWVMGRAGTDNAFVTIMTNGGSILRYFCRERRGAGRSTGGCRA